MKKKDKKINNKFKKADKALEELQYVFNKIFQNTNEKIENIHNFISTLNFNQKEEVENFHCLNIGQAIELLKKNGKICRESWNRHKIFLILDQESQKKEEHFIKIRTIEGNFSPWTPNNVDLLANDYFLITT